jgi:kynurenine formamidase
MTRPMVPKREVGLPGMSGGRLVGEPARLDAESAMGDDAADPRGALRFIDADKVRRSCQLVRTGQVIPLSLPLTWRPAAGGRPPLRRTVRVHNAVRGLPDGRYVVINDDDVEIPLQGSSQWDGLAHFGVIAPGSTGVFYGGRRLSEVGRDQSARTLGIEKVGGIVTRAVVFDFVDYLGHSEEGFLPGSIRITDSVVERYLADRDLELEPGDAVIFYTGMQQALQANEGVYPREIAGLDASTVRIWQEARVSAIACDNPTPEAVPPLDFCIHIGALRDSGIFIGELWSLEELVAACAAEERYECLLASAPLNVPGAFGSPCNAVAVL